MMDFDYTRILRSVWNISDLKSVSKSLLPLFPQLETQDLTQIIEGIQKGEVPYFEIPHYPENDPETDVPVMVLVFKDNQLFVDIFDSANKQHAMNLVQKLAAEHVDFIEIRPLTSNEWDERLAALETLQEMALESIEDDENSEEFDDENTEEMFEDEDSEDRLLLEDDVIYKDEEGIVDRGAFVLYAKAPAVEWLNVCLERENQNDPSELTRDAWTIEEVNRDPQVFLVPIDLELMTAEDQLVAWEELKFKSFAYFLNSFYHEEEFWPAEISLEIFNEWFDMRRLGYVVDLQE